MGFVKNAVKSIFSGGSSTVASPVVASSPTPTTVVNTATGATPAPSVADATQQGMENNAVLKKKRGKSSLLVNTADTSATSSGGTGLNI